MISLIILGLSSRVLGTFGLQNWANAHFVFEFKVVRLDPTENVVLAGNLGHKPLEITQLNERMKKEGRLFSTDVMITQDQELWRYRFRSQDDFRFWRDEINKNAMFPLKLRHKNVQYFERMAIEPMLNKAGWVEVIC